METVERDLPPASPPAAVALAAAREGLDRANREARELGVLVFVAETTYAALAAVPPDPEVGRHTGRERGMPPSDHSGGVP